MDLSGNVALVTGGGTGIGRAIAEYWVQHGGQVVVCGRREGPLEAVCETLGDSASYVRMDLAERGDPERTAKAVQERHGRLDTLINNGGTFLLRSLAESTDDEIERVFRVNVFGLLALTRACTPLLVQSQGSVVNLSSTVAQGVLPGSIAYAGSKAAVEQITRCLAAELGPRGVRVNCVAPGLVATDMTTTLRRDPDSLNAVIQDTPLRRVGEPADIAPSVAFLGSKEGGWVTGQVVQASGGLLL